MFGNDAFSHHSRINFNYLQKGCLFDFQLQILTLLLDPNYCPKQ